MTKHVRYAPDIEQPLEDKEALMTELEEIMVDLARRVRDAKGHAFHGTHAKLTGLMTGRLEVLPDLPIELAQGLFAKPSTFDAVVRFSPGPPEPTTDQVSGQRGLSIKVLGVEGERLPGFDEEATQDWVLGLGTTFAASTARDFKQVFQHTGARAVGMPETAGVIGSRIARAITTALDAIGVDAAKLKFIGQPRRHPFGESFFSAAPIRHGDHIAKLGAVPSAETVQLIEVAPPLSQEPNAYRDAANAFATLHPVVYDIKVQLCVDLAAMPVEDAAVEWKQKDSPYRTVGRLTLPPQSAWTPERAAFDDRMAFNPAHALVAHRPLGSIMRARIRTYRSTQRFRLKANDATLAEPRCAGDVP